MTACKPDAHALLIVSADDVSGMPAPIAAWRAGVWPNPAESIFPITVYSMSWDCKPERLMDSARLMEPSSVAGVVESPPPNLPIAVRAAPAM